MAAAGKAWFANNGKGSEVGLSIDEARLRPLINAGGEGEQGSEQRYFHGQSSWVSRRGQDLMVDITVYRLRAS